jgi:hypothetical protein
MGHENRPEGPSDMTADNIAPEDVPTQDPGNTEIPADGETKEDEQ